VRTVHMSKDYMLNSFRNKKKHSQKYLILLCLQSTWIMKPSRFPSENIMSLIKMVIINYLYLACVRLGWKLCQMFLIWQGQQLTYDKVTQLCCYTHMSPKLETTMFHAEHFQQRLITGLIPSQSYTYFVLTIIRKNMTHCSTTSVTPSHLLRIISLTYKFPFPSPVISFQAIWNHFCTKVVAWFY